MSDMTTAERRDADERTWALTVFLGVIDVKEMERIVATLELADLDRFLAVLESFRGDLAHRDLNGPPPNGGTLSE